MRRTLLGAASVAALLHTPMALASETIRYSYDPLGRLKEVGRSGSVNNGILASYAYDPASNRTNVTVIAGSPPPPPETPPSFTIADASITEGGALTFTVTKTGTVTGSYSLNWATANGSAAAGSDYTAGSGILAFAAADTTKTITVPTIDDTLVESSETVLVNLSGATGGATISRAQATGTIQDNDVAPPNQPPVANTDSASVVVCRTVSVNVIANDTDPDGNYPLRLTGIVSSTRGSAVVESNTNVSFTAFGTTGTGVVKYTVADAGGASATGTLNVTVRSGVCQ